MHARELGARTGAVRRRIPEDRLPRNGLHRDLLLAMHRGRTEGRHDLACSSAGRTGQSPFECPARHSRSGADPPATRRAGGCCKWCIGTVEDYLSRGLVESRCEPCVMSSCSDDDGVVLGRATAGILVQRPAQFTTVSASYCAPSATQTARLLSNTSLAYTATTGQYSGHHWASRTASTGSSSLILATPCSWAAFATWRATTLDVVLRAALVGSRAAPG